MVDWQDNEAREACKSLCHADKKVSSSALQAAISMPEDRYSHENACGSCNHSTRVAQTGMQTLLPSSYVEEYCLTLAAIVTVSTSGPCLKAPPES